MRRSAKESQVSLLAGDHAVLLAPSRVRRIKPHWLMSYYVYVIYVLQVFCTFSGLGFDQYHGASLLCAILSTIDSIACAIKSQSFGDVGDDTVESFE
jgi:hypothetical protein